MEKVTQEVTEYTRSQPVALLIAAGVGMLLGMLLTLVDGSAGRSRPAARLADKP